MDPVVEVNDDMIDHGESVESSSNNRSEECSDSKLPDCLRDTFGELSLYSIGNKLCEIRCELEEVKKILAQVRLMLDGPPPMVLVDEPSERSIDITPPDDDKKKYNLESPRSIIGILKRPPPPTTPPPDSPFFTSIPPPPTHTRSRSVSFSPSQSSSSSSSGPSYSIPDTQKPIVTRPPMPTPDFNKENIPPESPRPSRRKINTEPPVGGVRRLKQRFERTLAAWSDPN